MALSGQKAVTTAGTQVVLGSQVINGPLAIKALAANTGLVFIGDSAVDSASGFQLAAAELIVFDFVGNLAQIWVDSAVNGEGVAWLALHP
jgi:hypothetical protein